MPKTTHPSIADFTVAQLKAMLAAKTQIDELESQRVALQKDLARVDGELAKLYSGAGPASPAPKKQAKKKASKKAAKKRVAAKTVGRKVAKEKAAKKAPKPRATVESIVIDLIKANGGKMAYQDILATIQDRKLVKSKAKSFDNVLRRTISTSERIKRASRGVYSA